MSSISPDSHRRKPYAKFTCLACQKKKARCQLSSTFSSPSNSPLPVDQSCARCLRLGLTCMVAPHQHRRNVSSPLAAQKSEESNMESSSSSMRKLPSSREDDSTLPWFRRLHNTNSQSSASTMSYRRRPSAFLAELLARTPVPKPLPILGEVDPMQYFDTSMLANYESK